MVRVFWSEARWSRWMGGATVVVRDLLDNPPSFVNEAGRGCHCLLEVCPHFQHPTFNIPHTSLIHHSYTLTCYQGSAIRWRRMSCAKNTLMDEMRSVFHFNTWPFSTRMVRGRTDYNMLQRLWRVYVATVAAAREPAVCSPYPYWWRVPWCSMSVGVGGGRYAGIGR